MNLGCSVGDFLKLSRIDFMKSLMLSLLVSISQLRLTTGLYSSTCSMVIIFEEISDFNSKFIAIFSDPIKLSCILSLTNTSSRTIVSNQLMFTPPIEMG